MQKYRENRYCRHTRESRYPEVFDFKEYWIPDKDLGNDEYRLLQEPQVNLFFHEPLPAWLRQESATIFRLSNKSITLQQAMIREQKKYDLQCSLNLILFGVAPGCNDPVFPDKGLGIADYHGALHIYLVLKHLLQIRDYYFFVHP